MIEQPDGPTTPKGSAVRILAAIVAAVAVSAAMSLAYAFAPDPSALSWSIIWVEIAVFMIVYVGLTVMLFMRVKTRDQLTFVGITVLTGLITFFVLSFSWLYRQIEIANPGSFNEPISKMSAVYFAVAVLSTVGFGDIQPLDDISRAVVTAQMILGVGLLATTIALVAQAARHVTRTPQASKRTPQDSNESAAATERAGPAAG